MGKADDDATTLPFSKLPPPIKPIRPSRIAAPPDFSPNYVPRAPAGLVAFASIPETLAASSEAWQVPPGRMPARANLVAHARPIEEWLEANNERAAGIHKHNGELLWAPAATWRMSSRIDGKEVSAFVAAMHGRTIGFPAKYGGVPLLSNHVLSGVGAVIRREEAAQSAAARRAGRHTRSRPVSKYSGCTVGTRAARAI